MTAPIRMNLVREMLHLDRRAELDLAHRLAHPELYRAPRGGLTTRQRQLLDFLERETAKAGITPSFEEMAAALDLKSKSGIHRYVTALEDRGFIKRGGHGSARSIQILRVA